MSSMLIVVLLLTSSVANIYADDIKDDNNYVMTGNECGNEAHEIGGIVTLASKEGDVQTYREIGSAAFLTTQTAFKELCLNAKMDSGDGSLVFLKDIPANHGSMAGGFNLRICCMSNRICGDGELQLESTQSYIKSCEDIAEPHKGETCDTLNGFMCSGVIPGNTEKKICCTDTTPKRCPNGKRVETVCDGDDFKCNAASFFVSGHSCLKSDKAVDKNTYCCGVNGTVEEDLKLIVKICDEDKCPGGYDPYAGPDHDKMSVNCNNNKFGYIFSTTRKGIDHCCPRLMNQQLGWTDLEVVIEKVTDVGLAPKKCTKNSECGESKFCDAVEHSKLRNIKSTESFCFPEGVSLKVCKDDTDCNVDDGEICSGSMGSHFLPLERYVQSFNANSTGITHVCFQLTKCDPESAFSEKLAFLMEKTAVGNGFPKIKVKEHVDSEKISYSTIEAKNHLDEPAYSGVSLSCAWKNKGARNFCKKANTTLAHMAYEGKSTAVVTCAQDGDCTKVEHDPLVENPVCTKNKKSDKRGVCGLAAKCPSTNLEIRLEDDCYDDDVCGAFGYLANTTLVGKCTKEPVSKKTHCCPIIREGVPRWPYTTKIPCQTVNDCVNNPMFKGIRSLYCDNSNNETSISTCAYVGLDTALKSFATKCTSNKDCENHDYKGICAVTQEGVFCHENPAKLLRGMRSTIKSKWINMCIGSFVGAIVFAVMSLLFFLKYRSRYLCDKFTKNPKNKESKEKTEESDPATDSQNEKSQMKSAVGQSPK